MDTVWVATIYNADHSVNDVTVFRGPEAWYNAEEWLARRGLSVWNLMVVNVAEHNCIGEGEYMGFHYTCSLLEAPICG